MNAFWEFVKQHKFTVLLVLVGLVLAILFFTIGFWRTILLFLILALFFFLGYMLDKGGPEGIRDFFHKLFSKDS
ncbi:MAG: DUF2273 domain-containing protein [Clostridiales bacterium]|nr:DUF2273 domain-containing protein [Clostridiales bacterium]